MHLLLHCSLHPVNHNHACIDNEQRHTSCGSALSEQGLRSRPNTHRPPKPSFCLGIASRHPEAVRQASHQGDPLRPLPCLSPRCRQVPQRRHPPHAPQLNGRFLVARNRRRLATLILQSIANPSTLIRHHCTPRPYALDDPILGHIPASRV